MSAAGGSAPSERAPAKLRRLAPARKVADERRYLYQIIETIGSGPDLESILQGIVHLVTQATGCHACLIWFEHEGRLVLRSASAPYAHLSGSVSMGLGEGLAGWVFRTRRSAFIRENALQDPRVKFFPELEDEEFQSLVTVPILARAGDAIGVIALHAEAPHEFVRTDLDFLEHTAALIAGAVENARLYEQERGRVALLSALSRLSQRIASAEDQGELLNAVVDGVREVLGATRVEIRLASPDDPAPVHPGTDGAEPGVHLVVPLVAGDDRLGTLEVLLEVTTPERETALAGIAADAAVALKQHQAIARLVERNQVVELFRALGQGASASARTGELAARLGCDLSAPHVVVHAILADAGRRDGGTIAPLLWSDRVAAAGAGLEEEFAGALVASADRAIRAIVPAGGSDPEAAVASIAERHRRTDLAGLSIGISDLCTEASSYARGFEEAEAAAEVGSLLRGGPGVTTYEELGPYRYVLGSEGDARDRTQRRLARLVEYDRRRKTRLLDTLEAYLDHRGNIVATSRSLYIHPNTLRQRLERIGRLSRIDLQRDDWLSVAVATKIVKLQRLRLSLAEGGNDG